MGAIQVLVSTVGTLFVYAMIAAGVFKLFQIATDLGEMKDILKDMKRSSEVAQPPAWASPAMIRDESYSSTALAESKH